MNKVQRVFYKFCYVFVAVGCLASFFISEEPNIFKRIGFLLFSLIILNGFIFITHNYLFLPFNRAVEKINVKETTTTMNKLQKMYYIVTFIAATWISFSNFYFSEEVDLTKKIGFLFLSLVVLNGFVYIVYTVHKKFLERNITSKK